ncbi:hypothetical protein GPY51_08750 [Photorhabdus laumondii subsp. laumondii]|nr:MULTISPECIES: hypothetical protein [Photorhabdus]AXG46096.1 hypothetical protein PluTT01m_04205 [Photorhabdus laumondii subsp. laumondii]KTL60996.1 hypothetical protein AA106_01950 [Photorhabdus laumondii subsp. laumondii]MCC8383319.1 hypothetical protein [Photorhabdus laumondii]MCC8412923.1 hypothetical protein [Photorhabdus laumondii]NDK94447.1 hypothetical protein [Photorhabdus laumondii subsp. laumondii]
MIKEICVNLNFVSSSATLTGFKPKKSNTEKEKRETRKPKYQFNENKEVKYDSENVKAIKLTTIKQ